MSEAKDEPRAFIKWGEMPAILAQANTGGVKLTLLTKIDGALLSVAGESGNNIENMLAALVGNMWKTYEDGSKAAYDAEALNFLFVDCENGKLGVTRIGKFLLCMYADKAVEVGLLKAKVTAFANALDAPLGLVYPVS